MMVWIRDICSLDDGFSLWAFVQLPPHNVPEQNAGMEKG